MESNSSLLMCTIACNLAFSNDGLPFPQPLRHDANIVVSYRIVPYLQCCYAWVVMSNAVHKLLKVLHKCGNTDVLEFLLIYLPSPSGAVCPWESYTYISQTPHCRVTM